MASNEEWIASSLSLLAMTAWSLIEPHLAPVTENVTHRISAHDSGGLPECLNP
jgi:hypothetical protein